LVGNLSALFLAVALETLATVTLVEVDPARTSLTWNPYSVPSTAKIPVDPRRTLSCAAKVS
jgi:hypothetical protein